MNISFISNLYCGQTTWHRLMKILHKKSEFKSFLNLFSELFNHFQKQNDIVFLHLGSIGGSNPSYRYFLPLFLAVHLHCKWLFPTKIDKQTERQSSEVQFDTKFATFERILHDLQCSGKKRRCNIENMPFFDFDQICIRGSLYQVEFTGQVFWTRTHHLNS